MAHNLKTVYIIIPFLALSSLRSQLNWRNTRSLSTFFFLNNSNSVEFLQTTEKILDLTIHIYWMRLEFQSYAPHDQQTCQKQVYKLQQSNKASQVNYTSCINYTFYTYKLNTTAIKHEPPIKI